MASSRLSFSSDSRFNFSANTSSYRFLLSFACFAALSIYANSSAFAASSISSALLYRALAS
jgi:hypothetical protein